MGFLDFFSPDWHKLDQLSRQLVHLERKIDLILDHLGLELGADERLAEVKQLLAEGHKIDAAKSYRELYPGLRL